MIPSSTSSVAEASAETTSKTGLLLSEALNVADLSPRNTKTIKLSDLDINEFVIGQPCPLKLADGVFLKDGTRLDTVTFSPVIQKPAFASSLRGKLENARKPEAQINAIAEFFGGKTMLRDTIPGAISHLGDIPIEEVAKEARTKDNKVESIFTGMTVSDIIILQIAARMYVNPRNPFAYAIAVNECKCEKKEMVFDTREVDSVTGEDLTELHSIEHFTIRYADKVKSLKDLPLYGVKLIDPFTIPEVEETIDELYFRPMLLRELAAMFEATDRRKGLKDVDTATQLQARVAAMPQSSTFGQNKPGEIFESRFYNFLSFDTIPDLEQVLMNLRTGTYNGISQDLFLKVDCPLCPAYAPQKLEAAINWISPFDFIYASARPRAIPRR